MRMPIARSFLVRALLGFVASLFLGCEASKSHIILIDGIPFCIYYVELPYDLSMVDDCYFGKSSYNTELNLSMDNTVLPFGVVCGGGDGETAGTYAEIVLETRGYSLIWMNEEVFRYSLDAESSPRAYKLIKTDPDAACGGDLVCCPISIRGASMATVEVGREQIVVFTPSKLLIRKGRTRAFSCVSPRFLHRDGE